MEDDHQQIDDKSNSNQYMKYDESENSSNSLLNSTEIDETHELCSRTESDYRQVEIKNSIDFVDRDNSELAHSHNDDSYVETDSQQIPVKYDNDFVDEDNSELVHSHNENIYSAVEVHHEPINDEIASVHEEDTDSGSQSYSIENRIFNQSEANDIRCQFRSDKAWIDFQHRNNNSEQIKKPDELEDEIEDPPIDSYDGQILNRVKGSLIGMALGDAVGAHVEFRPRSFLIENPVQDLEGGGTWGLAKGQFTDDTSMALCLANSLIARKDFVPYDQLVRYNWWYKRGYMSSTGQCFDIGTATSNALDEFQDRQKQFAEKHNISLAKLDFLSDEILLAEFDVLCSEDGVAGNGALMRLAPVPLFFYHYPDIAVELSGVSGVITHGDRKSYDACRYYGALIVAALCGYTKDEILDDEFYAKHIGWFNHKSLHPDVLSISKGSYKKSGGYDDGIRGKGYIINALEAALWAFWSDNDSFKTGTLAAVNLGDDTDTTAAIYGQLAGAFYGYSSLPQEWTSEIYANKYLQSMSKWMCYEAKMWSPKTLCSSTRNLISKLAFPELEVTTPPSSTTSTSPDLELATETKLIWEPTTPVTQTSEPATPTKPISESTTPITQTKLIWEPATPINQTPEPTTPIISSPKFATSDQIVYDIPIEIIRTESKQTNPKLQATIFDTIEKESRIGSTTFSQRNQRETNIPIQIERNIFDRIRGEIRRQPENLAAWSVNDVTNWMETLGFNLSYIQKFREDHMDGFRLYRFIDDNVLLSYGINNLSDRQRILQSIQDLKLIHDRRKRY